MDELKKQEYRAISLIIHLTPQMNQNLSESAARAHRSKAKEAAVRLDDHLINFSDIATVGLQFKNK